MEVVRGWGWEGGVKWRGEESGGGGRREEGGVGSSHNFSKSRNF